MKITARGEYGTRAMVELAVHWRSGPVPLAAIAQKQVIPRKFLEQLLSQLRGGNLVEGFRGANGGYQLARDPSEITLLEIVEALEGPLTVMECHGSEEETCGLWGSCGMRDTWLAMEESAREVLRATTLRSLAERQLARQSAVRAPVARRPIPIHGSRT